LDQIFIWKFDLDTGKLSQANPASVPLSSGDGPRHVAFHPNGKWFYSLQEEGSTLVAYDYDAEGGKLRVKQTISTLPEDFKGTNFTSEVMIFPGRKISLCCKPAA
jgi:6-phosphogluconolactonase (cycloisomerase 2 family)